MEEGQASSGGRRGMAMAAAAEGQASGGGGRYKKLHEVLIGKKAWSWTLQTEIELTPVVDQGKTDTCQVHAVIDGIWNLCRILDHNQPSKEPRDRGPLARQMLVDHVPYLATAEMRERLQQDYVGCYPFYTEIIYEFIEKIGVVAEKYYKFVHRRNWPPELNTMKVRPLLTIDSFLILDNPITEWESTPAQIREAHEPIISLIHRQPVTEAIPLFGGLFGYNNKDDNSTDLHKQYDINGIYDKIPENIRNRPQREMVMHDKYSGHAIVIVGYGEHPFPFYICKNSLGKRFGLDGFILVRMDLCTDFGHAIGPKWNKSLPWTPEQWEAYKAKCFADCLNHPEYVTEPRKRLRRSGQGSGRGLHPTAGEGMKVYSTEDKELIMEPVLKWAANPNIIVSVKAFGLRATVQVLDLQVFACPRITINPLVPRYPCFCNIFVSLMDMPRVDFGRTLLGADAMSIPGLYGFVQEIVKDQVANMYLWPKTIQVQILDLAKAMKRPVGILNVKVVRASKLKKKDLLGVSDPYVKLKLNEDKLPSKKTTVKHTNLNPEWNEEFTFSVKDPESQVLDISVYDWEQVGTHNKMGVNVVPLKELTPEEPKTFTIDLLKNLNPNDVQNEKSRGQRVVEVMFKPSNEVQKAPEGTPERGGLLVVIVHEAQDLEGKHHVNPSVRLFFRGEEKRTKPVKRNKDARWEEEFKFMLEEKPANDRIHVEVVSVSSRMGLLHPKVLDLQVFACPCIKMKLLVPSYPCFCNIFVSLMDKMDWLNKFLECMWPYLDKAICNMAKKIAEPIIAEQIPKYKIDSVEFEALTLGCLPPTLQGMKVYSTEDKELITEPVLKWAANPNIIVAVKAFGLRATIQNVHLITIDNKLSYIGSSLIQEIIMDQVATMYIWPKTLQVNILDPAKEGKQHFVEPIPQYKPNGPLKIHDTPQLPKKIVPEITEQPSMPLADQAKGSEKPVTQVEDEPYDGKYDEDESDDKDSDPDVADEDTSNTFVKIPYMYIQRVAKQAKKPFDECKTIADFSPDFSQNFEGVLCGVFKDQIAKLQAHAGSGNGTDASGEESE